MCVYIYNLFLLQFEVFKYVPFCDAVDKVEVVLFPFCVVFCQIYTALTVVCQLLFQPSFLLFCLPSSTQSVWCNNIRGHCRWLSSGQGGRLLNLLQLIKPTEVLNCLLSLFTSLLQALHTAASSTPSPRSGPSTWAQRTLFLKPMMADLKTFSRISLKSESAFVLWVYFMI